MDQQKTPLALPKGFSMKKINGLTPWSQPMVSASSVFIKSPFRLCVWPVDWLAFAFARAIQHLRIAQYKLAFTRLHFSLLDVVFMKV